MDFWNKQMIWNGSVLSLLLTMLLSAFGAEMWRDTSGIGPEPFILFLVLFFFWSAYHVIITLLHFVVGMVVRTLRLRLLVFNGIGLLLVGIIWIYFPYAFILAGLSAFALFSLASLLLYLMRSNPASAA